MRKLSKRQLTTVQIAVANAPASLATGSAVQTSVVMGTVASAIEVPNSALTSVITNRALVTLLKADGTASKVLVTTGLVGPARTEITAGLTVDQKVVLADKSTALPTNSTATTGRGGTGGAGGKASGG